MSGLEKKKVFQRYTHLWLKASTINTIMDSCFIEKVYFYMAQKVWEWHIGSLSKNTELQKAMHIVYNFCDVSFNFKLILCCQGERIPTNNCNRNILRNKNVCFWKIHNRLEFLHGRSNNNFGDKIPNKARVVQSYIECISRNVGKCTMPEIYVNRAQGKMCRINFNQPFLCYFFTKSYVWPL